MPSKELSSEETDDRAVLLGLQREANEHLLLSALHASEQVDDAKGAQQSAEQEVSLLKAGERELLARAEFRERLIGIIGHDLRTPLSSILMASGLLHSCDDLSPRNVALVGRIARSGRRMERMISQLVDFTRVRLGGGFALDVAPTNLGEVCRDVAEELRLTSEVPVEQTATGDLVGSWDADRLSQALSNIAGNAVGHAAAGTAVRIEARGDGAWVEVEITNQGVCIPPELVPVIFTAFRRAERKKGDRSGHLGLGLFVACELTRAHGGTLTVHSSDGQTSFTMRLPRAPVSCTGGVS